jgi:hypothetical protein
MAFLAEIENSTLKLIVSFKRSKITKAIWKKRRTNLEDSIP